MTPNDSIKIVKLLKEQIDQCDKLVTDHLAFSKKDYLIALDVVLKMAEKAKNG